MLYSAQPGERFGLQVQGTTTPVLTYVGIQMASEYQDMQHLVSAQPPHHRSHLIASPHPLPIPSCEMTRVHGHVHQRSHSVTMHHLALNQTQVTHHRPEGALKVEPTAMLISYPLEAQNDRTTHSREPSTAPTSMSIYNYFQGMETFPFNRASGQAPSRAASLVPNQIPSQFQSRAPSQPPTWFLSQVPGRAPSLVPTQPHSCFSS